MKEARGNLPRDDVRACQLWVRSLTKEELLRAMEFDFIQDDSGMGNVSHEYEILKEMVQQQSIPPVPIHPRALSFRPASQFGPTDGRDEVDRVYQNRFRRPRLFQLLERGNAGCGSAHRVMSRGGRRLQSHQQQQQNLQTRSSQRRFDVVAKRAITPWGQVLGVGCTAEQKEADDILLKAAFICHKPCKPDRSNVTTPSCCFLESIMGDSSRFEGAPGIIRVLHVASRGRFLVLAPTTKARGNSFAPWFDPTQQWFSLPMYLASRFEVAIWNAFRNKDSISLERSRRPLEDVAEQMGRGRVRLLIQRATLRSLVADVIPRDVKSFYLRDTLLWQLLASSSMDNPGLLFSESPILSIWVSPLVEINSPVDQMRRFLRNHLQELVAEEMEKALLDDENNNFSEATSQRRRKKKTNKKKKRSVAKERLGHDDLFSCPSDEQEDLDVTCRDDDANDLPQRFSFPDNGTSARQRTRNVIACLTIMEETIEAVFKKVGLPETEPFGNDDIVEFATLPATSTQLHGALTNERSRSPERHKDSSRSEMKSATENLQHLAAAQSPDDEVSGKRCRSQSPSNVVPLAEASPQAEGDMRSSVFESPVRKLTTPSIDQYGDITKGIEIRTDRSPSAEFSWGFFDETVYANPALCQSSDRSILEDLFLDQERHDSKNGEVLPASSTAASIASSSNKEFEVADIDVEINIDSEINIDVEMIDKVDLDDHSGVLEVVEFPLTGVKPMEPLMSTTDCANQLESQILEEHTEPQIHHSKSAELHGSRSPSPEAPATPSPRLSPLLFSLADLRNLRRSAFSEHNRTPPTGQANQSAAITAGSLPSSPIPPSSNALTMTWSREDLRISTCRDDLQITGKKRAVQRDVASASFARIASKTFAKPLVPTRRIDPKGMQISQNQSNLDPKVHGLGLQRELPEELCARSETYAERQGEEHNWNEAPRTSTSEGEVDVNTITRDGSTTITSALSQREEETAALREERNSYRDLCLTLGSEVAKLRNLLAAHKGASIFVPFDFSQSYPMQINQSGFDPASMRPFLQNTGQTLGTMSDAGLHRGDESQVSEDDHHDAAGFSKPSSNKRQSSSATPTGSDTSVEPNPHNVSCAEALPLNRDPYEAFVSHGLHSRLTKDIINFLNATTVQLRKQDTKRRAAFERMTRLVTTLWPRAQVKLYGSHVTGLCLPSSDLDFVICLPAVHKNALAVAPGVLEGRNAINETSQKLLARKLKGESWIDPRSIKTIERTVVPVIKVSTKDTRARILQLDISFDSPEHHGLEAVDMIRTIMDELPMIRPLVLVLKQFLLDRGLLTAYTGGLSSYCLFLMVVRYLQEQPPSWGDCGSLLMGFLDFYGNSFDPRALGISIRRRQYFARPNYAPPRNLVAGQAIWNVAHLQAVNSPTATVRPDILRRNSFSDRGNVDAARGVTPASLSRPPRFQPSATQRFIPPVAHHADHGIQSAGVPFDHGRPYTFDPLFVEDPLAPGNNVGRNAFRIFQVQRAFSDAHRALVASLEWDLHSSGELNDAADYPLLKCLLQSEDVFYEL